MTSSIGAETRLAQATIFQLPRIPEARAQQRAQWWWLAALAVLGWLGSAAFLAAYRNTQIGRFLTAIAPSRILFGTAIALAVVLALVAWGRGQRSLAGAALMIVAYLAGNIPYALLYQVTMPRFSVPFTTPGMAVDFAVARLIWGCGIGAVCLGAWWSAFGRQPDGPSLALGHGDWSVRGRDVSVRDAPSSWGRRLVAGYLGFMVVLFVLMQANVGFAPIRSGNLLAFLPGILLAAVANATAEEFVFRGLIQPAFIAYGGLAAGLWMQGLLFGLMHWNNSVGLLAALPVSLLIGLGSVAWGKAAWETRGLTWVIIAHALVDVAVMGAFFIPTRP